MIFFLFKMLVVNLQSPLINHHLLYENAGQGYVKDAKILNKINNPVVYLLIFVNTAINQ
jgi:hypothetical protein